MSGVEGSDSDAPEELTSLQGALQDEEIRKVQRENESRVKREGKERRKRRAQRTNRTDTQLDSIESDANPESKEDETINDDMLPPEIVNIIASGEKKVFASDSENEELEKKARPVKKKPKKSKVETVVLNDMSPPGCIKSALEFLNEKQMKVSRSSAVLKNSSQALRFISSSGLLK